MKKIFVIDWLSAITFIFTACSGIGLHISGHGDIHATWHGWAVFHVLSGSLFFVMVSYHVLMHRNWYMGIVKNGLKKKSKITALLSAVFPAVSATGFALFCVSGANSVLGLWHYKIGIALIVLSVQHVLKRLSVLRVSCHLSVQKEPLNEK